MNKWMWTLALLGLALWTLLAWGVHALVAGGGDWLGQWLAPVLAPEWEAVSATALAWAERLGVAVVWVVWALGGLAMLAAVTLVTGLWRIARGRELPAWLRDGRRMGDRSTA
jgi:hypothetical protein